VKLLKHLQHKYLQDVSVHDEGDYWNTDSMVEKSLKESKAVAGETPEQMMGALKNFCKKKLRNNEDASE
jgi:hypothetical protein